MGLITANTPTEKRIPPDNVDAGGGEWEFRRLTGHQLDLAEEMATKKAIRLVAELPADAVAAIQKEGTRDALAVKRRKAIETTYDPELLIEYGLVSWPYPEPCDKANKLLLDAASRDWCAAVVVEMNVISEGEGPSSGGNSQGGEFPRSSPALSESMSQGSV
jgi:hypothetical protein